VRGLLTSLDGYEALRSEDTEVILQGIIPNNLVEEFEGAGEADFSYAVPEIGRFRVNAFKQRGQVSVVMRFIPLGVPRFEELNLPQGHRTARPRGARDRPGHRHYREREVHYTGLDDRPGQPLDAQTRSHHRGPHRVPAQGPQEHRQPARGRYGHRLLLAGAEARAAARPGHNPHRRDLGLRGCPDSPVPAAETGHLALTTLHTVDATETVNRMIDLFPPHERGR
jgi:twitching motility protein PilT